MRLKRQKCGFLLPTVSYLGHIISAEGLHTEESKVQAIVSAPEPQNVGQLRAFIGMVNYYGKFLPDLATVLSPLYQLLQKSVHWTWGKKQREACWRVKEQLRSGKVLTHFSEQLPLILACDTSPYGLGAVLSHRMPNGEEKPYFTYVVQSLFTLRQRAIIFGVKRYHQYLHGRRFEIKTDHKFLNRLSWFILWNTWIRPRSPVLRSEFGQITTPLSPGSGDGYRRDGQLKTREIKLSFNCTTVGEMS